MTAPDGFTLDTPRNRSILDCARALAILSVIHFHVINGFVYGADAQTIAAFVDGYPWVLNLAWRGFGVDVIFVVSAFLLGHTLIREQQSTGRISLRDHFVRRASRILPLYFLAIAFYGAVQGSSAEEFLWSSLFLGFTVLGRHVIIVGGWAMEVLMLAYIVLPFAVIGLTRARRPWLWIAAALVVSVGIRAWYLAASGEVLSGRTYLFTDLLAEHTFFELYHRPWFRVVPFVVGLGLAFLVTGRAALAVPKGVMVALGAALLALVWLVPLHDQDAGVAQAGQEFWLAYWAAGAATASVGTALILWGLVIGPGGRAIPGAWFWALVSRNLYAVFLFHTVPVLAAAWIVFGSGEAEALANVTHMDLALVFVLSTVLTLAIAIPLTRFVERPAQAWLRRRLLPHA